MKPFIIWKDIELELTKKKLEDLGYLLQHEGNWYYKRFDVESNKRIPMKIDNLGDLLCWQAMMMTTGTPYIRKYIPEKKEWHCFSEAPLPVEEKKI